MKATRSLGHLDDEVDIYAELGINGEDLAEVFEWMHATYDTDCSSVTPKNYDINEPPGRWFSGAPYKRVTIGQVLEAIERGKWIAPE